METSDNVSIMLNRFSYYTQIVLGVCIFGFIYVSNLGARDNIFLTNDTKQISINPYLEILEDSTGNLTIQDVIDLKNNSKFKSNHQNVPNFGFTESVYWVKFKINSENLGSITPWVLEVVYPNIHFIDLYHFDSQNQIVNIYLLPLLHTLALL